MDLNNSLILPDRRPDMAFRRLNGRLSGLCVSVVIPDGSFLVRVSGRSGLVGPYRVACRTAGAFLINGEGSDCGVASRAVSSNPWGRSLWTDLRISRAAGTDLFRMPILLLAALSPDHSLEWLRPTVAADVVCFDLVGGHVFTGRGRRDTVLYNIFLVLFPLASAVYVIIQLVLGCFRAVFVSIPASLRLSFVGWPRLVLWPELVGLVPHVPSGVPQ